MYITFTTITPYNIILTVSNQNVSNVIVANNSIKLLLLFIALFQDIADFNSKFNEKKPLYLLCIYILLIPLALLCYNNSACFFFWIKFRNSVKNYTVYNRKLKKKKKNTSFQHHHHLHCLFICVYTKEPLHYGHLFKTT